MTLYPFIPTFIQRDRYCTAGIALLQHMNPASMFTYVYIPEINADVL